MTSQDSGKLPAVDVIICTHNRPELLVLALAAVVSQTYQGHITCTVVFDQTQPDMSLESAGSSRTVKVVPNTRTPGLAGARNTGIVNGLAPLVSFCDDDDVWSASKLELQVACLSDSAATACVTGIVIEYGDSSTTRLPDESEMTFSNLIRNRVMPAHPSTVLVRRQALIEGIGLVDEDIPGSYAEDYDWILRAARFGTIAVVREPLVTVRWGQSLFSSKWQTIIDALDYLIAKFPEFSQDRVALARLRGQQAFGYAALGQRRRALSRAFETLRLNFREKRGYLTVPVALGLVSAGRVMDAAHRRGRGI